MEIEDETVPESQAACHVCGESSFVQHGGFYYCSLCNTQSQSARVYVDEDIFAETTHQARVGVLREKKGRKERSNAKDPGHVLSSWEMWNIVLKYMADRLVEIGFPDTVRSKIFHLYVAFLMKRKVIFISKVNPEAKSTMTLGDPKTNLYAIYGIKPPPSRRKKAKTKLKLPPLKRRKEHEDEAQDNEEDLDRLMDGGTKTLSRAQKKQKATMSKRKALEKDYLATADAEAASSNTVAEFEDLINQQLQKKANNTTDLQAKEKQNDKKKIAYSRGTIKLGRVGLLKGVGRYKTLTRINSDRHKPNIRAAKKLVRFERFTYRSCLILVFVSLRQLGFPILLSDISRLYHVGILNISGREILELARNIDEYKDVKNTAPSCFFNPCAYVGVLPLALDTLNMISYLGIKEFRYPQFKEMIPKFMDEFVLPREFECLVSLINHALPFDNILQDIARADLIESGQFRIVPEVVLLAQLVVVLKMLFGLDDRTERSLSAFAKLVNEVMRKKFTKLEEFTELFVIEDWFGYLQRRKKLVSKELSGSFYFTPNDPVSLTKLNDLLERKCCISRTDEGEPQEIPAAAETASETAQEIFNNLFKSSQLPEIPVMKQYVPLPLPTQSIVDQYLQRYPAVADPSFKPELFKSDFADKRIDFLWNTKKYAKFLEFNGYKVKIIQGTATNNSLSAEEKEELEKSNTIVVFQPYKSFDDFVGTRRDDCSHSIKFLLSLCEDIVIDENAEKVSFKNAYVILQKFVNSLGNSYITKILTEQLPVLMRWDESLSDSD